MALAFLTVGVGFRPLAGISCVVVAALAAYAVAGFRPLAGISCVFYYGNMERRHHRFRPLAGISCVVWVTFWALAWRWFPSPRGDKLCPKYP